jgi:tetratricopeptide (TPR) repeat protein
MAIQGSLRDASFPDVIQLLFLGHRTGRLAVSDHGRHASVYFEDGWVIHATIVNRLDRLGDTLVKSGRITAAQLTRAVEAQTMHRSRRLGELLVDLGAASPADVRAGLRRQVEEVVYTLFSWSSGNFSFEPEVRPDDGVELVRLAPDVLLLEGAQRVDEWALIGSKIPGFDAVFALDPSHPVTESSALAEPQRRLIPLIDGSRDVRQLVEESGLTEFETSRALYGLLAAGWIRRVGTSTPLPSARSLEARLDEHRNLGVAFYRTGMLDEASREFRRILELRPAEGSAPFHLGLIAARQGRWEEAVGLFRSAADRAGPRPGIVHNLGVVLGEVGEVDQAEVVLTEAVGRAPGRPGPQLSWALVALRRGEPKTAILRLARARESYGEPPPIWYWAAARARAEAGDQDAALAVAREGVEAWPDHAVLLNCLGALLEAAGDPAAAEAVLQRALAGDASLPQVSKNLGDVLYRLGRYDEAWEAYQRAARLRPDLGDDLHFKLGNLALKRGDPDAAGTHWRHTLELNPRHHLARANLQSLGARA